jgi:hypothetical protein
LNRNVIAGGSPAKENKTQRKIKAKEGLCWRTPVQLMIFVRNSLKPKFKMGFLIKWISIIQTNSVLRR